MTAMIAAELFHKTKHEICLSIGGQMYVFHDYVNQREYDLGDRLWSAIERAMKPVEKWEKYPAEGGSQ